MNLDIHHCSTIARCSKFAAREVCCFAQEKIGTTTMMFANFLQV
jgi:hypothetical protein